MISANNQENLSITYSEQYIKVFPNTEHIYPPNSNCFCPHWHEWIELLFVFSGSITVQVDQESFTAKKDDVVIFFPKQLHGCVAGENGCQYHIIMFNPTYLYNQAENSNKYITSILENENGVLNITNHPEITNTIKELLILYTNQGTTSIHPMLIVSILYKLLALIHINCITDQKTHKSTNSSILKTIKYIKEHFNEPISTVTLSESLGYETSYFIRLFKKYIGVTPRSYIRSIRLEKAKKMLTTKELPINEIARLCGFENMSYFTRSFQEIYNITPSAYRKQNIHQTNFK